MNENTDNLPLHGLRTLYDDIELAILFDWLELPRPEPLAGLVPAVDKSEPDETTAGPVRLVASADDYNDGNALCNAVARLVLSGIQGRLPQWAAIRSDGSLLFGRQSLPRRTADVALLPRFLCMINWADSGPGYSWPESYYVTYLPGFDRYIVTASQDSPEVHGYTDEAIGHFAADQPVEEGAHRVIVDWWGGQARGCGQQRWAYLFQTGEIDDRTAHAWAAEVWDEETAQPLACLP